MQEKNPTSLPNRLLAVPQEFSPQIDPLISQFSSASASEIRRLERNGLSTLQAVNTILHKLSRVTKEEFLEEEISIMMEITGLNRHEALRVLLMREELYTLRTRGLDAPDAIRILLARVKERAPYPSLTSSGSKREAITDKFRRKKRLRHGISTLSSSLSSSISNRLHFPEISSGFPLSSQLSPISSSHSSSALYTPPFSPATFSPSNGSPPSPPSNNQPTTDEFIYDPLFSPIQPEEPHSPEYSEGASFDEDEPSLNTTTSTDTNETGNLYLQGKMERLMSYRQIRIERKINKREGKISLNSMSGEISLGLRQLCFKRGLGVTEDIQPQKRQHLEELENSLME
eukprot:TRINITY_DN8238_c0_g1_i1.p1 TRINITY_DN8238_c0_g1~~TRINITY_DN8238_c0_g1_i1.p1  ORF type:complete len:344 (+),score=61.94 TRINITY_DN8238_c0_g1_i1:137-1168(+)